MTESERKFQEILLKKSRRDKLLAKLEELKAQKSDLTQKSSDLQRTLEKENADVARLETKTISSFLLSIAGKKVEKLNKDLTYFEGFLAGVMKKLGNERFVSSAPAKVVETEHAKKRDAEAKIAAIKERLAALTK